MSVNREKSTNLLRERSLKVTNQRIGEQSKKKMDFRVVVHEVKHYGYCRECADK